METSVEAKVEHRYNKLAEQVFDSWLQPDQVRIWLRAALLNMDLPGDVRRVEIDARVGGHFTWSDMREGGEAVHWGSYLSIERPHRLVFTWFTNPKDEAENASVVTLTLQPSDTGCVATLRHEMKADYAQYLSQTEQGWSAMLSHV